MSPSCGASPRRVARSARAASLPDSAGEPGEIAARLEATRDPQLVGTAICELLDVLREQRSPEALDLRTEVHARLRALADREVDLVADALA